MGSGIAAVFIVDGGTVKEPAIMPTDLLQAVGALAAALLVGEFLGAGGTSFHSLIFESGVVPYSSRLK